MSAYRKFAGIVLGVVALATTAGTAIVFAQNTETGPQIQQIAQRFQRDGERGGPLGDIFDRDAKHAVVASALGITVGELEAYREDGARLPEIAEELGVDVEGVKAAVDAAKTDAVNQAVADGTITQEQADQILSGEGRRGGRGNGLLRQIFDREAKQAVVAGALGIAVDELEAYREDGTRLPEIVEELGVDVESVKAAVDAAKTDAVNQAVEDGTITQEQADQILSSEGRPGRGGRGFGGPGGRGPANGDGPAGVQQDA